MERDVCPCVPSGDTIDAPRKTTSISPCTDAIIRRRCVSGRHVDRPVLIGSPNHRQEKKDGCCSDRSSCPILSIVPFPTRREVIRPESSETDRDTRQRKTARLPEEDNQRASLDVLETPGKRQGTRTRTGPYAGCSSLHPHFPRSKKRHAHGIPLGSEAQIELFPFVPSIVTTMKHAKRHPRAMSRRTVFPHDGHIRPSAISHHTGCRMNFAYSSAECSGQTAVSCRCCVCNTRSFSLGDHVAGG